MRLRPDGALLIALDGEGVVPSRVERDKDGRDFVLVPVREEGLQRL